MYFLDFGGFAVAGSSPEILVRVDKGEVTIRPIAGTRKRGATPTRDKELADELLSDPKELAEHLMLLDLGRNDVGRVAKIGTVKVTDKFFLEYYSHVMHIVSNVVGELDPKYDFVDALSAGFPAGTVSGAPKVRAMEIIDELEKSTPRHLWRLRRLLRRRRHAWTPASCSAPRSSRTASSTCRRAPASSPTASPSSSSSNAKTRPAPFSAPPRKRYATPGEAQSRGNRKLSRHR